MPQQAGSIVSRRAVRLGFAMMVLGLCAGWGTLLAAKWFHARAFEQRFALRQETDAAHSRREILPVDHIVEHERLGRRWVRMGRYVSSASTVAMYALVFTGIACLARGYGRRMPWALWLALGISTVYHGSTLMGRVQADRYLDEAGRTRVLAAIGRAAEPEVRRLESLAADAERRWADVARICGYALVVPAVLLGIAAIRQGNARPHPGESS